MQLCVADEAEGRLDACCIHRAVDGAAILEHARRVGMPGDNLAPSAAIGAVRPDPAADSRS